MQKKRFVLPAVTFGFILTALFSVFFLKSKVSGQETTAASTQTALAPVKSIETENATERSSSGANNFVEKTSSSKLAISAARAAASANSNLKFNLNWAFGGKAQRGWYLYEALIQKQIGTTSSAESTEFALALADWQQKESLLPTGILDKDTFAKIIEIWQGQRLGKRGSYATEDALYSAPINNFWDVSREASLLKVERETYAAYKQMIAAAAKDLALNLKVAANGELAPDEPFLKIVSAFRSREHQEQLRRQSPGSGSAGLAVNSPHFTGHALDMYVGGEPVTTKDFNRAIQVQTPVYKWLVKNAERFGFYPYFYEPWHWEYVPQNLRPAASSLNAPREFSKN